MTVEMHILANFDDDISDAVQADEGCHFDGITLGVSSHFYNRMKLRLLDQIEQYLAKWRPLMGGMEIGWRQISIYFASVDAELAKAA